MRLDDSGSGSAVYGSSLHAHSYGYANGIEKNLVNSVSEKISMMMIGGMELIELKFCASKWEWVAQSRCALVL